MTTETKCITFKEKGNKDVCFIPTQVFRMKLKPYMILLYCCLVSKIGKNDLSEVSYTEIGDLMNVNKRTAMRALNDLEGAGLVKRIKRAGSDGSILKNAYVVYNPDALVG